LIRKPERKISLETGVVDIRINLREMGWELRIGCISFTTGNSGGFLLLLASQEKVCSMELLS
jgi:hypothetical protein